MERGRTNSRRAPLGEVFPAGRPPTNRGTGESGVSGSRSFDRTEKGRDLEKKREIPGARVGMMWLARQLERREEGIVETGIGPENNRKKD